MSWKAITDSAEDYLKYGRAIPETDAPPGWRAPDRPGEPGYPKWNGLQKDQRIAWRNSMHTDSIANFIKNDLIKSAYPQKTSLGDYFASKFMKAGPKWPAAVAQSVGQRTALWVYHLNKGKVLFGVEMKDPTNWAGTPPASEYPPPYPEATPGPGYQEPSGSGYPGPGYQDPSYPAADTGAGSGSGMPSLSVPGSGDGQALLPKKGMSTLTIAGIIAGSAVALGAILAVFFKKPAKSNPAKGLRRKLRRKAT